MGYCIVIKEADFHIRTDDKAPALEAIKTLAKSGTDLHWVKPEDLLKAQSLKEAVHEFGYALEFDPLGEDVIGISFHWEKLGYEEKMFKAIAPFVKSGSYIHILGEGEDQWRWYFKNGELKESWPEISWPEE